MELKVGFLLLFIAIGAANGEFDVASVINTTQHLQDIERGGSSGLYPQLNPFDSSINYGEGIENRAGGGSRPFYLGNVLHPMTNSTNSSPSGGGGNNDNNTFTQGPPPGANRPFYLGTSSRNSTAMEKFINKTLSGMPSGVCTKEVPTSSLVRPNELPAGVAGNGSDPSLSRIQICCEGYQRNPHIFRKCDPICGNGCANGICIAPNTCACYPDYIRNANGQCIPSCPIGCENGICNGSACSCNEGFELESSGKFCVLKCESGYRAVNGNCKPFCSKGCENGLCVAPETCQCQQYGWKLDATGSKCVPKCDKPCLNGVCSGPNQCSCATGYVRDVIDPYRCNPACNPLCENAMCSGPNMCLCYQGYVKDRSVKSGNKCVKI